METLTRSFLKWSAFTRTVFSFGVKFYSTKLTKAVLNVFDKTDILDDFQIFL